MELAMHPFQMSFVDVCVNLCSSKVGMAEELFDDAEIGPSGQQMGCKRMT